MTAAKDTAVLALHNGLDPFNDFEPAGWVDPTDRWDSHHAYFDAAVAELRPRVIVEVGSFLGASSRHFAALLEAAGLDGVVICCDTWLAERVLWGSAEWRPHLRHVNGRPEYYKCWLANALAAGLEDYLCPLPMDSRGGARYLADCGIAAEVVYIDGSHEPGDVAQDLALYWEVLRPGGVMLIDDYHALFPGVVGDVDEFCRRRGLALEVSGIKARIRKAYQVRGGQP